MTSTDMQQQTPLVLVVVVVVVVVDVVDVVEVVTAELLSVGM